MKNEALEDLIKNWTDRAIEFEDVKNDEGISLSIRAEFETKAKVYRTCLADLKKCVGKPDSDTSGGLHLACVSGSAISAAEDYIKEYFKLPENWTGYDKLPTNTDLGIILDLLVGFAEKHYC